MQAAEQPHGPETDAACADMGHGFDADDDNDDGPEPLQPMDGPADADMLQSQTGASHFVDMVDCECSRT